MNDVKKNFGMFGEAIKKESPDETYRFEGCIPENLELFQDHFPDFPILPGVLALEVMKRCLEHVMSEERLGLQTIQRVKFSSYLLPGEPWRTEINLKSESVSSKTWKVKLLSVDRLNSSAEFQYVIKN